MPVVNIIKICYGLYGIMKTSKRIFTFTATIIITTFAVVTLCNGTGGRKNIVAFPTKAETYFDSPYIGNFYYAPDSAERAFSLEITHVGSNLVGNYCYVFDYGKKMDCTDDYKPSFTIPIPTTADSTDVIYYSALTSGSGTVRLIVSGQSLIWKIIQRPHGENYAPSKVLLVRQ